MKSKPKKYAIELRVSGSVARNKMHTAWELLPVQEVVFVEVSDTGSDLAGHALQLQQLSSPEPPVLLRQVSAQIPLQTQAKTHTISIRPGSLNKHI